MTATETLDKFIATLNGKIEGAILCVQNAEAFHAACADIEQLIRVDFQGVMSAFGEKGPGELDRQRLEACLARLIELESRGRARVVWAQDFEEYIRRSASEGE